MSIRLLIVEASSPERNALAAQFAKQPEMAVVGNVGTELDALPLMEACDLALVSTSLPDDGAYHLARLNYQNEICTPILIIGADEPKSVVLRYLEAGAYGFFNRNDPFDCLLIAIHTIHRGEAIITGELAAGLINRLAEVSGWLEELQMAPTVADQLTRREREVLYLIGRNYTNQDIANHLIIEVGTVKNHVHNILAKLNVNSRREAASFATFARERPRRSRYSPVRAARESYVS